MPPSPGFDAGEGGGAGGGGDYDYRDDVGFDGAAAGDAPGLVHAPGSDDAVEAVAARGDVQEAVEEAATHAPAMPISRAHLRRGAATGSGGGAGVGGTAAASGDDDDDGDFMPRGRAPRRDGGAEAGPSRARSGARPAGGMGRAATGRATSAHARPPPPSDFDIRVGLIPVHMQGSARIPPPFPLGGDSMDLVLARRRAIVSVAEQAAAAAGLPLVVPMPPPEAPSADLVAFMRILARNRPAMLAVLAWIPCANTREYFRQAFHDPRMGGMDAAQRVAVSLHLTAAQTARIPLAALLCTDRLATTGGGRVGDRVTVDRSTYIQGVIASPAAVATLGFRTLVDVDVDIAILALAIALQHVSDLALAIELANSGGIRAVQEGWEIVQGPTTAQSGAFNGGWMVLRRGGRRICAALISLEALCEFLRLDGRGRPSAAPGPMHCAVPAHTMSESEATGAASAVVVTASLEAYPKGCTATHGAAVGAANRGRSSSATVTLAVHRAGGGPLRGIPDITAGASSNWLGRFVINLNSGTYVELGALLPDTVAVRTAARVQRWLLFWPPSEGVFIVGQEWHARASGPMAGIGADALGRLAFVCTGPIVTAAPLALPVVNVSDAAAPPLPASGLT